MRKEQITSTRTAYWDNCPICKEKIKGFSERNFEDNMRLHKEGHEKDIDLRKQKAKGRVGNTTSHSQNKSNTHKREKQ